MSSPLTLWKTGFIAPDSAMPGLLEALEPLALSVSIFEASADDAARTLTWRVELIFAEEPDAADLGRELEALATRFAFVADLSSIEAVADQDWLAVTAMQTAPIRIGRFFVHGSAARDAVPQGSVSVEVDAGLAFGSGEHATTQCCLQALEALLDLRPRRILDLGCGSAVLGIAAARASMARVLAVDNDPVAVRVAAENARINRVAGRLTVALSEGWAAPVVRRFAPYDIVLANILADPLIAMAPRLARHLAPSGSAVLSGFVARDVERVAAAHRGAGLRVLARIDSPPWAALVVRRLKRR